MFLNRFRLKNTTNYTKISNKILRDKNLSLKAKGLLTVLFSLPPDWDFTVRGIVTQLKESERSVYATIKELQEQGYLTYERVYESGKIYGYEYTVFEIPVTESQRTALLKR